MPKTILMEEIHVSLFLPTKLPDDASHAVRRTLGSARFEARLIGAVRAVLRHYPSLKKIHLRMSR